MSIIRYVGTCSGDTVGGSGGGCDPSAKSSTTSIYLFFRVVYHLHKLIISHSLHPRLCISLLFRC